MLPNRLEADSRAVARTSHAIHSRTSEDDWLEIDSTSVDALIAQPLPAPERQLTNFLTWLKAQAGDAPFSAIDISNRDAMAAIVGAVDAEAFERILQWATKERLVEAYYGGDKAELTPKGWENGASKKAEKVDMPKSEPKVDIVRGHCPKCGPDRRAEILGSHEERSEHDDLWAIDTYSILRCRGCDKVYIRHECVFSEDAGYEVAPATGEYELVLQPRVTYWPAPARRRRPDWLNKLRDEPLRNLLDEMYGALDSDHRVLAAIGARTALDRAMVLKKATEALGFRQKLDELKNSGVISEDQKDILMILTDAGSGAAHRGWRPDLEQLNTIMDGMELFLQLTLVLGDAAIAMKNDVPNRSMRPKKSKSNNEGMS